MPNLRKHLVRSDGRPRKAAYALPSLFTAGNLFLGFFAILRAFQGAMEATAGHLGFNHHFEIAAMSIGVSVFLDGLDGRIARMTNTVSDFGRELDSLADVIAFGVAPAVLAWAWGFQFTDAALPLRLQSQILNVGYFLVFVFVLCGAARLARFNIAVDPRPSNPGRPGKKYFVGLPIPAAAGMVASVVYAAGSEPLTAWPYKVGLSLLLALVAFLMVSTWRYRSFKDFDLLTPRSPWSVVRLGIFLFLLSDKDYSKILLFGMSLVYVGSGIVVRIGGLLQRKFRSTPPAPTPDEGGEPRHAEA
jgi:CDP-diacylglycerol---serine O-phosphatidyltransferase